MINRRDFLKLSAMTTAGLFIPVRVQNHLKTYFYIPAAAAQAVLDPAAIGKYITQCVIPPAMPRASEITLADGSLADYYEIAIKQFSQHILPENMGLQPTPVWSFVKEDVPATYNYPGFTIEAMVDKPVRVKWINGLKNADGTYLPHLLPVDPTLHWANPPGPQDMESHHSEPYTGPVPSVVHVHGAHTHEESDGYPEAWYLPDAVNIPQDYFKVGTFYERFKAEFADRWGVAWEPGSAVFQYPNDMCALTSWFHDHVLGITRLNVYAGPAAFFLLRGGASDLPDGVLPGPAPDVNGDPFGTYYEIPLGIQDRSFNPDGTLFYPDTRAFFEGLEPAQLDIPFKPDGAACDGKMSDVAPMWNPEFFGNTIVVNGRTWPFLDVEQRRYRLRLLNGCNSRFLILKLVNNESHARPGESVLPFWVIGNEGGFLPAPERVEELLIAPAERFDVIVDFSQVPDGSSVFMINLGPDEPFGGGVGGVDFEFADPATTGQVMKFNVKPIVGTDESTDPQNLVLPQITPLGPADRVRPLSLIELDSSTVRVVTEDDTITMACGDPEAEPFGPVEAHLGVVTPSGQPKSLGWDEPITEVLGVNDTEIWEFYNFTMDAHPIHVHQIHFEVVDRQALAKNSDDEVILPVQLAGEPRLPEPWERGFKETVIAYPGEVTRIKAKFDLPGLFVWHCHILEHEDNEMMRPFQVNHKIYFPLFSK